MTVSPRVTITAAIFDELDRQHEASEIDGAGYWDREWGRVDGEPNWAKVSDAVLAALGEHHAIVELPDPDERGNWHGGTVCGNCCDPGRVRVYVGNPSMSAAESRALAAALLAAAAKTAEEGQR